MQNRETDEKLQSLERSASLPPCLLFGKCRWLACRIDQGLSRTGSQVWECMGWGQKAVARRPEEPSLRNHAVDISLHVLLTQNLTSPFPFWKRSHSVGVGSGAGDGRAGLCFTQRCQRPEQALSTAWPSGLDTTQTSASGCWFGWLEDNPGYIRLSQESQADKSNPPSTSLLHFSLWNVCPSRDREGPGSEENQRGCVLYSPHLLRSYFTSQSPLIYTLFLFFSFLFFFFAGKLRERLKLQLAACIYCLGPHQLIRTVLTAIPCQMCHQSLIVASET